MRLTYKKSSAIKVKPGCSKAGKQNFPWQGNISTEELDVINELLRNHKRKAAAGKESWKLLPKDSCEVHRTRQKRNSTKKKKEVSHKRRTDNNSKPVVRFKRVKSDNKRRDRNKRQRSRRARHHHTSSSSSSPSSETYVRRHSSRCSSDSEMEYE